MEKERLTWDQYFMAIAIQASRRATCDRKHVGAVIVNDRRIVSTGYNGSMNGLVHCDDEGHLMENDHCIRTVHAEANAIVQAARYGTRVDGGVIYTTASPCFPCFKLIVNAGIMGVFYGEFYKDEKIKKFAENANIKLIDMSRELSDLLRS